MIGQLSQNSSILVWPTDNLRSYTMCILLVYAYVITRDVLRLVRPPILLLFIERWPHLADSNEPNFIKKKVFLNLLNLIGSLGHHHNLTHC